MASNDKPKPKRLNYKSADLMYEDESVQVYHGNCRKLTDIRADCIVTDPPYGVDRQSNARVDAMDKIQGDGKEFDIARYLQVCLKALRRHRHMYVFGFSKTQLADLPLSGFAELIWDKQLQSLGNLNLPWSASHEKITFCVYVDSAYDRKVGMWKLSARLRQQSVIACKRVNGVGVKNHPTAKPVPLLQQLLESSTVRGETVYDPFMGAGSTLLAAILCGRKAVGIDVDRKHCRTSIKLIKKLQIAMKQGHESLK